MAKIYPGYVSSLFFKKFQIINFSYALEYIKLLKHKNWKEKKSFLVEDWRQKMSTATESRPLFIRLTLPDGLEEALEGLAREVLRHRPDNIYEYAADHFEQLLKKRGFSGKLIMKFIEESL